MDDTFEIYGVIPPMLEHARHAKVRIRDFETVDDGQVGIIVTVDVDDMPRVLGFALRHPDEEDDLRAAVKMALTRAFPFAEAKSKAIYNLLRQKWFDESGMPFEHHNCRTIGAFEQTAQSFSLDIGPFLAELGEKLAAGLQQVAVTATIMPVSAELVQLASTIGARRNLSVYAVLKEAKALAKDLHTDLRTVLMSAQLGF